MLQEDALQAAPPNLYREILEGSLCVYVTRDECSVFILSHKHILLCVTSVSAPEELALRAGLRC